ncbi:DEAD/DEAH box helicase [Sphingobacterium sp. SRCM116780]|uniref:DEAD/DEAH box helicase n=1 Tax=Sphingobacterium sp. SRCM116780 TaxID=2907623 RepID=UPI001F38050B|nr:DEAD/DEAH box helicase [Sphingobacterium sp. SRCM116780]UIR57930.1 DEAD/DEAH box helicase [Sphingobacterium sp. SRCM116780]
MQIEAILNKLHISALNEMQQEVLDKFQEKENLLLLSPTGSGKTLAFALALMKTLKPDATDIQALILVPTRELALQIEQVLKKVATGFKITCCYGGHDTKTERNNLKNPPAILIGTPGRIVYHLDGKYINTDQIKTLVLDEFDKSLELGFQDQMSFIIDHLQQLETRILTSATAMKEIPDFTGISSSIEVNYLNHIQSAPALTIKKVVVPVQKKLEALFNLLCKIGNQKVLIFCNHRDAVDHISELLQNREIIHDVFHGGLEQSDRELALLKFRNNSNHILITTDLAARGLDIPEIDAIIHYQLPYKEDDFTHRNGRTARMQAKGEVFIILKPEEDYPYVSNEIETEQIDGDYDLPKNSEFATLYISAGKKDKVNKIDIVGFLLNLDQIEKNDVGIIEVKDRESFVAVKRALVSTILKHSNLGKIKGKKIRILRS